MARMNADTAKDRAPLFHLRFICASSALHLRFICAICVLLLTCGDADSRSFAEPALSEGEVLRMTSDKCYRSAARLPPRDSMSAAIIVAPAAFATSRAVCPSPATMFGFAPLSSRRVTVLRRSVSSTLRRPSMSLISVHADQYNGVDCGTSQ